MCNRFTLRAPPSEVARLCNLPAIPTLVPRYNIAPTQSIAVVRTSPNDSTRSLDMLRWGLIPSWAKDPKIAYQTLNARGETAAEKPAFRSAFRRRRCLIPADGFFEWQTVGKKKLPYHYRLRDGAAFAFAGLWEHWQPSEGGPVESCTILTTEANPLVARLHNRMPVILPAPDYDDWLDPTNQDVEGLKLLLKPYSEELMEAVAMSTHVNNSRHDDPGCLEPMTV